MWTHGELTSAKWPLDSLRWTRSHHSAHRSECSIGITRRSSACQLTYISDSQSNTDLLLTGTLVEVVLGQTCYHVSAVTMLGCTLPLTLYSTSLRVTSTCRVLCPAFSPGLLFGVSASVLAPATLYYHTWPPPIVNCSFSLPCESTTEAR